MRRETTEDYARRIFSSIENPPEYLEDCRCCEVNYKLIEKPKKSGGVREIYAPSEELKLVQRELLKVFHQFPVSGLQYGFVQGRSCWENARRHVYESDFDAAKKPRVVRVGRWMLRIDLQDAFPSIRRKPLEALYRRLFRFLLNVDIFQVGKENLQSVFEEWIELLLKLTTVRGFMPQGFPCSPYLLNLVLVHGGIIRDLEKKCGERERDDWKKYKRSPFKMSVYADDIVFSSVKDKIPNTFIRDVIRIIEKRKLQVNPDKIKRSSMKYKAHKITGLVLTGETGEFNPRVILSKKTRNAYRGKIHLAIQILKGGRKPERETDGFSVRQIQGYISRIRDVYRNSKIPPGLTRQIEEFENILHEYNEYFGH